MARGDSADGAGTTGMAPGAQAFDQTLFDSLFSIPFGNLTKRELEIRILGAAIKAGLIKNAPDAVALKCQITMAKAHGYLSDLALRQQPLDDLSAVRILLEHVSKTEVIAEGHYLSIPIPHAALRIWLERKISQLALINGDVLRRDHLKITPVGLGRILGSVDGFPGPAEAFARMPDEVKEADWYGEAKKHWMPGIGWKEALGELANLGTIVSAVPTLCRLL